MNRWLLRAPWWALALVCAGTIAPVLVLVLRLGRGESWLQALISGLVTAVACGAILAAFLRAQFRRQRDAVGDVPEEIGTRVAARGTLRGPVPTDPQERAATVSLLEHQLAQMRRKRPVGVALHVVMIGICGWRAVVSSPWWWAGVVFFAALLAVTFVMPRLVERRADLLRRS